MHRLGVIVPSSNTTVEHEFATALCGSNVSLHTARIHLNDVTVEGLEAMELETEGAAELLKDADVDLAVFACTSGSLFKGLGYDAVVAKKVSKAAGCPAITTSGAVISALKKLKVRRISLATPYIAEVNMSEIDFLEKSGFEVVKSQVLGITENLKIGRLSPNDAAALALSADSSLADAVFVSCTNFGTFQSIPRLETQLKKPVISSNSATLWAALNAMETKIQARLGKLFEP
jgi:maleate isomerase